MRALSFRYRARWGHFLRAEANKNGLTYPVPPRTALLGLLGAVLGLAKDQPQVELAEAAIGLSGRLPEKFWHRVKLRKDPPGALPPIINPRNKGTSKDELGTLSPQEWLWRPEYIVHVALPDRWQEELERRLARRAWYFTPAMGLSEMFADLELLWTGAARRLDSGVHPIGSVVPLGAGRLATTEVGTLALQWIRMPRSVDPDRTFHHHDYLIERDGRPVPVETDRAWELGSQIVLFL